MSDIPKWDETIETALLESEKRITELESLVIEFVNRFCVFQTHGAVNMDGRLYVDGEHTTDTLYKLIRASGLPNRLK